MFPCVIAHAVAYTSSEIEAHTSFFNSSFISILDRVLFFKTRSCSPFVYPLGLTSHA